MSGSLAINDDEVVDEYQFFIDLFIKRRNLAQSSDNSKSSSRVTSPHKLTRSIEDAAKLADNNYKKGIYAIHDAIASHVFQSPTTLLTPSISKKIPLSGTVIRTLQGGSHNYGHNHLILTGYYRDNSSPYECLKINGQQGNYMDGTWEYVDNSEIYTFAHAISISTLDSYLNYLREKGVDI